MTVARDAVVRKSTKTTNLVKVPYRIIVRNKICYILSRCSWKIQKSNCYLQVTRFTRRRIKLLKWTKSVRKTWRKDSNLLPCLTQVLVHDLPCTVFKSLSVNSWFCDSSTSDTRCALRIHALSCTLYFECIFVLIVFRSYSLIKTFKLTETVTFQFAFAQRLIKPVTKAVLVSFLW